MTKRQILLRRCSGCALSLPLKCFHRSARGRDGLQSQCKECRVPARRKQTLDTPPEKKLWEYAKLRASKNGRDFTISPSDISIPEICPVLGIPMTTPSLDRIDSAKGYVPDNIRVISLRANTLKNNATVAELELVIADLRRLTGV